MELFHPMSFDVNACGMTNVGLIRENNEDYWGIAEKERFYVLADGMGGHRAGEVAARELVTELCRYASEEFDAEQSIEDAASSLMEAIEKSNRKIFEMGSSSQALKGMGTTLCCLYFHPKGVIWAHVGDSRIYLLRKHRLSQLTKDHSLVSDMMESGQLDENDASTYQYKNILTKAVGTDLFLEPTLEIDDYKDGDRYLLCSDGLSDLLLKREMEEIMNRNIHVKECCKELIKAALEKGGIDNVTVLVVEVHESEDLF